MEKQVCEFVTIGDAGKEVWVRVFQNVLPGRGNTSSIVPGSKRFVTKDGARVNRKKQGEYEIASTKEILRSSDKNAP